MNGFCCLMLVCSGGSMVAQTNSPAPPALFSTPPAGLRLLSPEPDRRTQTVADTYEGQLEAAPEKDLVLRPEVAQRAKPEESFNATRANGGQGDFPWAIYERLERGGYLTRPEPPSENRLERFVSATFVPEVFQLRKVSLSCSIMTAIKRKNPLCLLNPIFLDLRW